MTRRAVVAVALALTLVVAGCVGTTDQSTSTGEPTTDAPTTAGTTSIETTTDAPTTAEPTTTESGDGDQVKSGSEPVDADALAASASSSLATAAGVVVEGNLTRTVETASGSTTVAVSFTERVDANARELGIERTVQARGRTVETATYLVNGTFYERSPAYERQYGTEWVRLSAEGAWTNASSTAVVTRLVNASDASVASNVTVDGERAVLLALSVNERELASLSGFQVDDSLNALTGNITVDATTGRVYAATVHVNRTVENAYGDEVTVVTDVTREFGTPQPVTVQLPDGADEATPINGTQA
jgi:PBP1b-binding outer membrane lipoprotein LpoB